MSPTRLASTTRGRIRWEPLRSNIRAPSIDRRVDAIRSGGSSSGARRVGAPARGPNSEALESLRELSPPAPAPGVAVGSDSGGSWMPLSAPDSGDRP